MQIRFAPSQAQTSFAHAMTRRRTVFKGAAAAILAALLGSAPLALASDRHDDDNDQRWVGTWTASPQAAQPPGATLEDQTIRQIVRTSVAGDKVRVRLSNEFGTTPLVVGAASIARHSAGAAISP